MIEPNDWRLRGQERYLDGVVLRRQAYRPDVRGPDWEHEHCAFCWAKFSLDAAADHLREGYCTLDEIYWVCDECFEDFKDRFRWRLAAENIG